MRIKKARTLAKMIIVITTRRDLATSHTVTPTRE
jgi:hypothetical protein